MTKTRTRAFLTGGAAVAALILTSAPAGAADGGPTRERCISAVDRRLATLSELADRARRSGPLTDAHEAVIVTTTTGQAAGLTALRAEVEAATTRAARAEACRKVVPDYRVYVLTRPKVHLTIAADALTAATGRLDEALARLQAAADTAAASGRDVAAAQAEIDAAVAGSAAARALAGGVPDAVLPLQPAGYPSNAAVLTSSRTTLSEANSKVRAAAQDAKDARGLLRA
jgi:hypothetical protein